MSDNTYSAPRQPADEEFLRDADAEFIREDNADETMIDGRIWRKTITAANIEAHPERAQTLKRRVRCCRIFGEVRGMAEVLSRPADPDSEKLTVLVGEICADAYNNDGEVFGFIGEQVGLPMAQGVMAARLLRMQDDGVDAPVVRFDLEYWSEPSTNPRGYSWIARNLMPIVYDRGAWLNDEQARRRLIAANNDPRFPQLGAPSEHPQVIEHQPTKRR